MIHPSYFELMDIVNKNTEPGEKPIVTSRYSIVLGTAKRARQIVTARQLKDEIAEENQEKPLSVAVDELESGKIHILPGEGELDE